MKISELQNNWLLIHGGRGIGDIVEIDGKMFIAMQFGKVEKLVDVPDDEYINAFYTFARDENGHVHLI